VTAPDPAGADPFDGVTPAAVRSCGGIVTVVGPPGPDEPLSEIGGGRGGATCAGAGAWITGFGAGGAWTWRAGVLPLDSQKTSAATTSTTAPPTPASSFQSGMVLTGGGTRALPQVGQTKGCFSSTNTVRRRFASAQPAVLGHLPGVFVMKDVPGKAGAGEAWVSSAAYGN